MRHDKEEKTFANGLKSKFFDNFVKFSVLVE